MLDQRSDRVVARLPNRMILVAQSLRTAPVVSVQVWVKTGSLYEQEYVGAGLSHFSEHLISGGSTTHRPESESTATLGRIGAQTNAATSLDTVRYYINTTATHTATAIDLLSDWMQNSLITEEEYAREREVIQSEFSMGQGEPNRIFWKLTQQARFAAHPDHPGAHPTIGYLDEFLAVTRDQIYAFYKRMYVPNNMVMVVAGDIDPTQAIAEMAERWADVPAADLPEVSFPARDGRAAAEAGHGRGRRPGVAAARTPVLARGQAGRRARLCPGPGGRGAGRRRVLAAGPQAARRAAAGDQDRRVQLLGLLGRRLLRGRLRAGRTSAVRSGPLRDFGPA